MRALGILSDRHYEIFMRDELDIFAITGYLFLLVFRLDTDSGTYKLIYGPEQVVHSIFDSVVTEGLHWPVERGDRIGVLIPDSCVNDISDGPFPCPSHINLRAFPNDCSAALYHSFNMSNVDMNLTAELASIPTNQFMEEQVRLSMEVVIDTEQTGTSSLPPSPTPPPPCV